MVLIEKTDINGIEWYMRYQKSTYYYYIISDDNKLGGV